MAPNWDVIYMLKTPHTWTRSWSRSRRKRKSGRSRRSGIRRRSRRLSGSKLLKLPFLWKFASFFLSCRKKKYVRGVIGTISMDCSSTHFVWKRGGGSEDKVIPADKQILKWKLPYTPPPTGTRPFEWLQANECVSFGFKQMAANQLLSNQVAGLQFPDAWESALKFYNHQQFNISSTSVSEWVFLKCSAIFLRQEIVNQKFETHPVKSYITKHLLINGMWRKTNFINLKLRRF